MEIDHTEDERPPLAEDESFHQEELINAIEVWKIYKLLQKLKITEFLLKLFYFGIITKHKFASFISDTLSCHCFLSQTCCFHHTSLSSCPHSPGAASLLPLFFFL